MNSGLSSRREPNPAASAEVMSRSSMPPPTPLRRLAGATHMRLTSAVDVPMRCSAAVPIASPASIARRRRPWGGRNFPIDAKSRSTASCTGSRNPYLAWRPSLPQFRYSSQSLVTVSVSPGSSGSRISATSKGRAPSLQGKGTCVSQRRSGSSGSCGSAGTSAFPAASATPLRVHQAALSAEERAPLRAEVRTPLAHAVGVRRATAIFRPDFAS